MYLFVFRSNWRSSRWPLFNILLSSIVRWPPFCLLSTILCPLPSFRFTLFQNNCFVYVFIWKEWWLQRRKRKRKKTAQSWIFQSIQISIFYMNIYKICGGILLLLYKNTYISLDIEKSCFLFTLVILFNYRMHCAW